MKPTTAAVFCDWGPPPVDPDWLPPHVRRFLTHADCVLDSGLHNLIRVDTRCVKVRGRMATIYVAHFWRPVEVAGWEWVDEPFGVTHLREMNDGRT